MCVAEEEYYLPTWWAPLQWWWALQPSAEQPDRPPPSSPRLEREHTHTHRVNNVPLRTPRFIVPERKREIAARKDKRIKQEGRYRSREAAWCKCSTLVSVIKAKWEQRSAETQRAGSQSHHSLPFCRWQDSGSCSVTPITGLKVWTQPLIFCSQQQAGCYPTFPPGHTGILGRALYDIRGIKTSLSLMPVVHYKTF